jgi:hypothetical protein
VSCRSARRIVNGKKRTVKKCTKQNLRGSVTLTASLRTDRATLSRDHVIVARGVVADDRVVLHAHHAVRRGRYLLTLVSGRALSTYRVSV